jgi:hypothetical protein
MLWSSGGEDDPEKEEGRIRKEEMKRENDQSKHIHDRLSSLLYSFFVSAHARRFGCLFESFLILPSSFHDAEGRIRLRPND